MCGIAGLVDWAGVACAESVERMTSALAHRGPDASHVVSLGAACLGHRRLAVIDLEHTAEQPMSDGNGRYHIVFNGEIYNYRELRKCLEAEGTFFRTNSDTEVALEAFKAWGASCLGRFNGMFALAIWDGDRRELFLARDRLGKKPLFYRRTPGGMAFASEIKAFASAGFSCNINLQAVGHLLSIGYLLGSQAIWQDVAKLPPAHYLTVGEGRQPNLHRYWDLAAVYRQKRRYGSMDEAGEELTTLLDDAVRLRLVADVPVGAFLSGGIDSSAIVASMCQAAGRENVRTFSAGFDERSYDERREAREVAGFLGVEHRDGVIARTFVADRLSDIAYFADEPFADTSIIPTYALAAFARRHVTVALSGDGGDELFAGYETYVADRLRMAALHLPGAIPRLARRLIALTPASWAKVGLQFKALQFLRAFDRDALGAHFGWREIFSADEIATLVHPQFAGEVRNGHPLEDFRGFDREVQELPLVDRMGYVDIKTWLADDILVKVDRATMAHALEARAPFLDYRLVEFAARLPVEFKLKGLRKKQVLRHALRDRLPPSVLNRRKKGFNAPVAHWLGNDGRVFGMLDAKALAGELFDDKTIVTLIDDHRSRRADNSFKLLALGSFALWSRRAMA